MKKLLIHSDNTTLNRDSNFHLSEQFRFDIDFDKKDVDFYIDEQLTSGDLGSKLMTADLVFIKVSLSINYLEYLGLRVAYHIRLTQSLGEKAKVPIVLIAEETVQFLGKTYPNPSILFSEGLYLIRESTPELKKAFGWYNSEIIKPIKDLGKFVEEVNITAPANYLSSHSITNEWCILRWSKVLGMTADNNSLKEIQKNIDSLLYYKFLQQKYPIKSDPDKKKFSISGEGKILYIDDEWDKGWKIVLNTLISPSPKRRFETLEIPYKDQSAEDIVEACRKETVTIDPEVVILDLRLSDSDFGPGSSKSLTGYKVLKMIKSINPGIQVLIFTASNKVWNLTELQNAGANDFLIKESPELSADSEYSKHSITKLASSISIGLKMSFLKKVHLKLKVVEDLKKVGNTKEELDFYSRMKQNLEVSFNLLASTQKSKKYFNYAYLQLFQIIEDFCKLPSIFLEGITDFSEGITETLILVNEKEVCVQKLIEDKILRPVFFNNGIYELPKNLGEKPPEEGNRRIDTNFKVSSLLIFRYGKQNSSFLKWKTIYSKRNKKAAHPDSSGTLNVTDIYELLDFMAYFFDPEKQDETNIEKGLERKAMKDRLDELMAQHNAPKRNRK